MSDKIKQIEEILKAAGADDFEITETKENGWEFYFIRHELDQNRAKDIHEFKVRAFKKYEDEEGNVFLGDAVGNIAPTATEDDIKKLAENLVYQAGFVKNPYYELNVPDEDDDEPNLKSEDVDVAAISKDFIDAFNGVKETETEDINSYEIFVSKIERHFVNSRGIDISFSYPSSMVEVVTNARNDKSKEAKEIELYRLYNRGTCDRDALIYDVEELLHMGKDKLIARDTPALGKAPLILSTGDAKYIYYYFLQSMNAARKYMGITTWEIGTPISDDIKGDKVTLRVLPELANSSSNFLYDKEGARVRERFLMKDSIPENFWGSRQFSEYLGLKNSSQVYNVEVTGGTKSAAELRTGPYLEVVEFSGFDCDSMTGDIAGEIRLGYWHDGEKITPVSGGSVSGSMTDFVKEMYMSTEMRQYDYDLIPAVTRLENVSITGIG